MKLEENPHSCRRRLVATVGVIALWLAGQGYALDPARDVLQYNCQSWGRQNGLPVSGINAIAQTQDGYLWLGTATGMLRFDGIDFKLQGLWGDGDSENQMVTSLSSAKAGGLWVGLEDSPFGHYDGRSFSAPSLKTPERSRRARTILETRHGTLWLGTADQIARLTASGEMETVFEKGPTASLNVISGYEDQRGDLWFGTSGQGMYRWQNGKIRRVTDPNLDDASIFCMTEDANGTFWIGTSRGLLAYDSNFQKLNIPQYGGEVRALLVDRQATLWIGTSGSGLARYQQQGLQFIQGKDGLAGDHVKSVVEDREGSLWIGTRDGVSQISDVKFTIQPTSEDPTIMNALAVGASRSGGVWFASGEGYVTRFDPMTKRYATRFDLPSPHAKRVFEASNGDLYVVNEMRNLVIFSAEKQSAVHHAPDLVVGMAEDPQGVVVSVAGELYRAGAGHFAPYPFEGGVKPPFGWIINLATGRDGCIWVASVNGIFRVKDGQTRQWSAPEGLTDLRVETIIEDQDGVVWAGLQSGIARLKDGQIRLINRKSGLFNDDTYSIIPDDLGYLWVDTARGIYRVTRQAMNHFADDMSERVECEVFHGIESVKVADKTGQERVGCKTTDGRIWFPSPRGVVMIDPANLPVNSVVPPVHIDSIRANGKEIGPDGPAIVPPDKGELEFQYNALTFISPRTTQFRHRLEGYDSDWVDAGDRRTATYTNLKPGRYTFRVIAANADGVWNKQGDVREITMLPHFYQTTWFYLLAGGMACAFSAGIYAWRVRHLKRSEQVLRTEVRSRTAELAEKNSSLREEIQSRKRMQLEIELVHKQLLETSRQAGMSEVANSVIHNVGNVLNSVNISCSVVSDRVRKSRIGSVAKTSVLLHANAHDLAAFLTEDPTGKRLPEYLGKLADQLTSEQAEVLRELKLLSNNIDHIKDIVAMQQNYAKISGVTELILITDLVEDSLRMNEESLARHTVRVVREYDEVPPITVEKHKALQILVNLIRNAKHACKDSGRDDKQLTLRVAAGPGCVRVSVIDNGVGIPAENLTRIFAYGFTTKADGHGFGLHCGALAATELGGSLTVHSDGAGTGATFTLDLPLQRLPTLS